MKKSAFPRSKFVLDMRQILQVMKMGKMTQCPWGSFEVLSETAGHKVKRIIVEPGGGLSIQLHHFRYEHWFVVAGTGDVTVGDKIISLSAGGSVDIPANTTNWQSNLLRSITLPYSYVVIHIYFELYMTLNIKC